MPAPWESQARADFGVLQDSQSWLFLLRAHGNTRQANQLAAHESPDQAIQRLELNDSIFEFVFPLSLGHDGSGEKGFDESKSKRLASMSNGNTPSSPQ